MSIRNEITPIDYSSRRRTFLGQIKKGMAFLPASSAVIRNNDVHYAYRQDSSFHYLTGFEEPQSSCLFNPQSKEAFQMFVHPKDKTKELWEGKLLGVENAKSKLGADAAFSSLDEAKLEEKFIEALLEADRLYFRLGQCEKWDKKILGWMAKASRRLGRTGRPLWPILDPGEVLGEMRLFKSKAEIDRLQVACNITSEAHTHAMRITKPGMYEYEVEAAVFHGFRACGALRVGYESIVASGPNACVLHYISNDRKMTDKDLLLVDAGAEYDYYTSDITRCFPVGDRFSPEQKEVYGAVLKAQKECIKACRPGKTLKDIHAISVEVLVEELRRMKILKGTQASIIKSQSYKAYYPHNTSHWIGMDVHDVGRYYQNTYDNPRKLEPGVVFSVEPGLYFAPDSSAPAKYKGIGVRIEDDILITSGGNRVLTSAAPKEIDEIESLRAQA